MKPIIIQGAESSEIDFFLDKLELYKEFTIGGFSFFKGNFNNVDVIISKTKVGEINAAAATTIGILNFEPRAVINQGTARGHKETIHKGDIVIGEKFFQINSYKSEYLGKQKGTKPINWTLKEFKCLEDKKCNKYNVANKRLLELAKAEIPNLTNKKIHVGIIGSGDVWNREFDTITYLNKNFNTLCEDMETAGVYKIANSFDIPVVSIRIISNNELLKEEYEPKIAKECQELIYNFVKLL